MELIIKAYDELTRDELFDIMKLRTAVFVVEQNCPYQEIDDYDKKSIHIRLMDGGDIKAYLRVLPKGCTFEDASIGRVLSAERGKGYAARVINAGIQTARESFGADAITIEAQTYAMGLYEKQGFVRVSEEFIEDGIPHVRMRLELK